MMNGSIQNIDAGVESRLSKEEIIWLTTVTQAGAPQPNPVWFYWDGEAIICYSKPDSYRIRNIQQNPMVSLNLQEADALGNKVVIINGEASLNPGYTRAHPGYVIKYKKYLPDMGTTMEELAASYSVEIRIKPLKVRT